MTKKTTTQKTALHFENGIMKPKQHRIKSAYKSMLVFLIAEGYNEPHRSFSADMTNTDKAQKLYSVYFADSYNVVKYLNSKTPLPMLQELLNGLTADHNILFNTAIAELADDYKSQADELTADIQTLEAVADSLIFTDEERATAKTEADQMHIQALADSSQAEATAKELYKSLSNSADLLQISALADREKPTETDFKQAEKSLEALKNRLAESEKAVEQSALIFIQSAETPVLFSLAKQSHRKNAIRKYIRSNASLNALDGTSTSYKPATAEAVHKWQVQFADSWQDRQPTKGGYKSLVYKEPTKTTKGGYFFKYENATYRQLHSFEALTTSTDKDGNTTTNEQILTSANTYIYNQTDTELLTDLFEKANLTERERAFASAFCSRRARAEESRARAEYFTEKGEKATERGASERGFTSRKAYSFSRIGITADRTQRAFYTALIEKLQAVTSSQEQTPRANHTEQNFDFFNRLLLTNHSSRLTADYSRCDLIQWTEQAKPTPHKAVVKWINVSANLTESERTKAEQFARLEAIRKAFINHIKNGIAEHKTIALNDASESAKVFLSALSLEELTETALNYEAMKQTAPTNLEALKSQYEKAKQTARATAEKLDTMLKWCTITAQIKPLFEAEAEARATAEATAKAYFTALQTIKNLSC